ncbi:hypothetical protein J4G37_42710, partial [Microvirga sp. 3-52]|nr:hypothetical protein [Microvirga sp. 3-52]
MFTLEHTTSLEQAIKKSRFIAVAGPLGLAPLSILLANALERLRGGLRSGCRGLGPDLEGSMSLHPTVS